MQEHSKVSSQGPVCCYQNSRFVRFSCLLFPPPRLCFEHCYDGFFFCFGEVRWRTIVRSSSRLCVRCIERGLNRARHKATRENFCHMRCSAEKKAKCFRVRMQMPTNPAVLMTKYIKFMYRKSPRRGMRATKVLCRMLLRRGIHLTTP